MLAAKPCTATCVIDGQAVTIKFYPDSGALRLSDATGACIQETRWCASWLDLLTAFRGFIQKPVVDGLDLAALLIQLTG